MVRSDSGELPETDYLRRGGAMKEPPLTQWWDTLPLIAEELKIGIT